MTVPGAPHEGANSGVGGPASPEAVVGGDVPRGDLAPEPEAKSADGLDPPEIPAQAEVR